jgi:hypothetical protein
VVSVQSNDQRLLERILEDQHRKLAPNKSRDDFFTFFAADKALQDWDLDNDEIMDGIVDGAHECGIDGIWTNQPDRRERLPDRLRPAARTTRGHPAAAHLRGLRVTEVPRHHI